MRQYEDSAWPPILANLPTVTTVHLGRLRCTGSGSGMRGRLFYSAKRGLIVAPQTRHEGGWRCEVVAAPSRSADLGRPSHFVIGDDDLNALPTSVLVWPADADLFALVWQTRVWQRLRRGHAPLVARVFAEQLRPAGSLTVDLNPDNMDRLVRVVNLRHAAAQLILSRLTAGGWLTKGPSGVPRTRAAMILAIPPNREMT